MAEGDNIFEVIFDALDPLIDILYSVIPPPFNWILAFIVGGVEELLLEVIFG